MARGTSAVIQDARRRSLRVPPGADAIGADIDMSYAL
jgi:hypothetical protein